MEVTAEEHIERLHRFMLSCQVEAPLTVLWSATEKQKQALNELCYRFNASSVRLHWSFSMPTDYLEGVLRPSNLCFGISPEGDVNT
jgi:hypothetical protein